MKFGRRGRPTKEERIERAIVEYYKIGQLFTIHDLMEKITNQRGKMIIESRTEISVRMTSLKSLAKWQEPGVYMRVR